MISLEDRQSIARAVQEAHRDGARLEYAGAVAGITVRTLQRWRRCEGLDPSLTLAGYMAHFPHISGVISANFPLSISCGKRVSELPTIQGLAAAAA